MRNWITVAILTAATLGVGTGTAHAQYGSYGTYRGLVESWYLRYLGRPADPVGMHDQIHALRDGVPPSAIEASILAGSEYYLRNGGTPQGYVIGLYRDVLNATPGPVDLNTWTQATIVSGRSAVAAQILQQRGGAVTTYTPPPTVVVPPPTVVAPPVVVQPTLPPVTVVTPRVYVPGRVYYPGWPVYRHWPR
jgi:hypothetical protein